MKIEFHPRFFATETTHPGVVMRAIHFLFSDAFAKLRKANIGFVTSVCQSVRLPVRMEKLGSRWTDFYET